MYFDGAYLYGRVAVQQPGDLSLCDADWSGGHSNRHCLSESEGILACFGMRAALRIFCHSVFTSAVGDLLL